MGRVRPAAEVMTAFSRKLKELTAARYPERGGGRKLAADLGVSPQQWSQWLGGKRFPLKEQRAKIAGYFGIDETELLPGSLTKNVAQEKNERNRAPMLQATGDLLALTKLLYDMQHDALAGGIAAERFAAVVADILRFANFTLYEMKAEANKPVSSQQAPRENTI